MARREGCVVTTTHAVHLKKVWQSMRILRRFCTAELLATTGATQRLTETFVRALSQTGYLRLVAPRVNGRPGSRNIWQLVRDTGPLPPVRRGQGGVWDANTQRLHGAAMPPAPAPRPMPPAALQRVAAAKAARALVETAEEVAHG